MAEIIIKSKVIPRCDTSENWSLNNPILLKGEIGVETDTSFMKIGDGESDWNSLFYTHSTIEESDINSLFT